MNRNFLKFCFDILASSVILILVSPLMLAICLFIKYREDGPVFFSQERIGLHGKPFLIYKFRTMTEDAEDDGVLLSHSGGDDDDRLTDVGRFLRAHHLDELPQLWNVLKGDMSFVGYRPERSFFIGKIMERDSRYEQLFAMRPGITSYAAIYNGYTDTMEKMLRRLELDLEYLEHHSPATDLRIMMLTVVKIISGKTL